MKTEYMKEMTVFDYEGQELQVVSVRNVSQPGGVGEDEILYVAMNRHGEVQDIMDWEISEYNAKKVV